MAKPNHICNVLFIDDEPTLRELIQTLLEEVGHKVFCAANGREALALLERAPPPCLILLDLRMPIMDGYEFYEQAQRRPHLKDVPIVVVSTHPGQGELAAAGFLAKPFDLDSLLGTVQRHCHGTDARLGT